jgi:hypothetical protein
MGLWAAGNSLVQKALAYVVRADTYNASLNGNTLQCFAQVQMCPALA